MVAKYVAVTTTSDTTDAGLLPPTADELPTDVASVTSRTVSLWTAIRSDSLSTDMTAFFPVSAYLQMKTGVPSNPPAGYQNCLVALYNMDLGVYRGALGPPPSSAELVSFEVDPSLAHWVPPRACANTIGTGTCPISASPTSRASRWRRSGSSSSARSGAFGTWFTSALCPGPRARACSELPAGGPGTPGPGGGC
jgi:hypothetical protein